MTDEQKDEIIQSAKEYFRETIIPRHNRNVKKLKLKDFKVNPFLLKYIAAFLCGDTSSESMAKALLYPRMLGTSISTTFGTSIQQFIAKINQIASRGSLAQGMDIEFTDAYDYTTKYCQCKAGPNTINRDDVKPILEAFKGVKNLGRTNSVRIADEDLILGVLYGDPSELNNNYKLIATTYPVYCGADFWAHLTGDDKFYYRITKAFGEVVEEDGYDGREIIQKKVKEIAKELDKLGLF